MSAEVEFIYHMIVAVAVGALVGVEREHHREEHVVLAGIRTFPLVSISGFALSHLAVLFPSIEPLVLVGFVIVGAFSVSLLYVQKSLNIPGFTTSFALVVTYVMGVLVGYGLVLEAVVVSVVTTALLISKRHLHRFAVVLTEGEIIAALEFVTISFILYPLALELRLDGIWAIFGRGGALDLSTTILIVIFVSSISFVSFLVVRWQGPTRGLRFSGLLGGLVNSEAATVSMCNLTKERKTMVSAAASGVILANATMFVRNLAVCVFADPTLSTASIAALPLLVMCGVGMTIGWMTKVESDEKEPLRVKSPFSIGPALKFAIMFVAVSAAVVLIQQYIGMNAIYVAALGGFISSAAVAASVSALTITSGIDPWVAAETILLACAISSLNKLIISRAMSPEVFEKAKRGLAFTTAAVFVALALIALVRISL